MYSFKYHLLTICAVFLALAVGLLLGAAIGGSGLMSSTTSGLIDSLSTEFTGLNEQNDELNAELNQNSALVGAFITPWQVNKLTGRNVLIVSNGSDTQDNAAREIAGYVTDAGGKYVIVNINVTGMGVSDQTTAAALQTIVPAVAGRDYQDVVSEALVKEWTQAKQTGSTFDGGQMSSGSDITDTDKATYPLTSYLLSNKIITIINSSSVPDTINSYVDTAVYQDTTTSSTTTGTTSSTTTPTYSVDPMGVRLGSSFYSAGASVVFTQTLATSTTLMTEASSRGVSGVSSYTGNVGRYSIISLLIGTSKGVYGSNMDAEHWYPALAA